MPYKGSIIEQYNKQMVTNIYLQDKSNRNIKIQNMSEAQFQSYKSAMKPCSIVKSGNKNAKFTHAN